MTILQRLALRCVAMPFPLRPYSSPLFFLGWWLGMHRAIKVPPKHNETWTPTTFSQTQNHIIPSALHPSNTFNPIVQLLNVQKSATQ